MLHSNFEKYAHLHIVVVQILQSRVRGEETGEAVCQLEVTAMFSQGDYEFGLQMALRRLAAAAPPSSASSTSCLGSRRRAVDGWRTWGGCPSRSLRGLMTVECVGGRQSIDKVVE